MRATTFNLVFLLFVQSSASDFEECWTGGCVEMSTLFLGSAGVPQPLCEHECNIDASCAGYFYDSGTTECSLVSAGCTQDPTVPSFKYFAKTSCPVIATVAPTENPTAFPTEYPTPYPSAFPTKFPTNAAGSTGDPHIKRIDGVAFDIDAVGSYDLLRIPATTGADFVLKTTVGKESMESTQFYNRAAEFTGEWVAGHNLTVVGQASAHVAGMYIDGELTPFKVLLRDRAYSRRLSEYATVHAEMCKFDDAELSEFCQSQRKRVPIKKRKNTFQPKTSFVGIVTKDFTCIVHVYVHHGNLDIYVDPHTGANLENVGGLLAPQNKKRVFTPQLASSSDGEDDVSASNLKLA